MNPLGPMARRRSDGRGGRSVSVMAAALAAALLLTACENRPKPVGAPEDVPRPKAGAAGEMGSADSLTLGPGDVIMISVFREDDLTRSITVDADGKINYPLVGELDVREMNTSKLRLALTEELKRYYKHPHVTVELKEVRSRRVVVVGEVGRPGTYVLHGPTSTVEAVGLAGGFMGSADKTKVVVLRQHEQKLIGHTFDIAKVLSGRDMSENPMIQNRDIVFVPTTYIADAAEFAQYVEQIIRPIVLAETGALLGFDIVFAAEGKRANSAIVLPVAP